jgi:PAS domain-containing protein
LWWSDESCRILGIEPGTFAGTLGAFLEFVHPDDRHLATPSEADLATATTLHSEYRIVRPDGTIRVIHEAAEIIRERTARRSG